MPMYLRPLLAAAALLGAASTVFATEVALCTDRGRITLELFDAEAPAHVSNFLNYTDMGHYSGTVFHRVVAGFVVQGGGFDLDLKQKATLEPVPNESRNGLANERGTVAAARMTDPHSATSQFFINLRDNRSLDATTREFGYSVFGRVLEGMDVVDEIAALPTRSGGPLGADVPDPLVAISSAARYDRDAVAALGADPVAAIRREIESRDGNDPETLTWVMHYRAVCGPLEPSLLLTEARAAMAAGQLERGSAALDAYFAAAEPDTAGYEAAVALRVALGQSRSSAGPDPITASGCAPMPAPPEIPDGRTAAVEEMVAAQTEVNAFLSESEALLSCLSAALASETLTAAQRAALVQAHDSGVGEMERVADAFNTQVRIIRRRR